MNAKSLVYDVDEYLDIAGQQGLLKIYTQICLCFPLPETSSHQAIINTLTNGLERLTASFPWVAGQVVNEGASEGIIGVFKIKPLTNIPRLVVKDLRHDPSTPTWDALKQATFPSSMLNERILCPRKTLPIGEEESASAVSEVFLLQANFITGGLLLSFLGQHQTMDMTGQAQVMDLFAKACYNVQFTGEELSSGNLSRQNIIPLLDESYKQGLELDHQMIKPAPPSIHPQCTWAYFTFSPPSLAILKSSATKSVPIGFISTDDALTALVWQAVTRARLSRLKSTTETTLSRAVDARRYLDIPATYTGLLQNMAFDTCPFQQLLDEPLGGIASRLRSAVDPKTSDLAWRTRAFATCIRRSPNKIVVSFVGSFNTSKDVMISSWSKPDFYSLDFNLGLGKPEAVRRPEISEPCEGLVYFMPKRLDGEVSIVICLRDEDMERLRADEGFTKYGTYIG